MTILSEKLADLSVRVGDIEARAEAFKSEQEDRRDQKLAEMRAELNARQDKLEDVVAGKRDEISAAWIMFNQSLRDRAGSVHAQIEAKKDAFAAGRAERRAERLTHNAMLAINFATLAMEDAELAVAEAVDAQIDADVVREKATA